MPMMPFPFSKKKDKSNARLWDNEDLNSSESDGDEGQSFTPLINSPIFSQPPATNVMDMQDTSTATSTATSTFTQPIKKSEIIRMDYSKAKMAIAPDFRPILPSLEELNKDLEEIEKTRAKKIKEEKSKKNSKSKTDALSKSKSKQKKLSSSWDKDVHIDSSVIDKGSGSGDQKFQDRSDKKSIMLWKNKSGYNDDFFLY